IIGFSATPLYAARSLDIAQYLKASILYLRGGVPPQGVYLRWVCLLDGLNNEETQYGFYIIV
ncbi:MAG: hypothetical protein P4L59_19465, partial [Desulfosporosinus sp.]|nr:hypothetical protein [Desulfosporosinus sp.]